MIGETRGLREYLGLAGKDWRGQQAGKKPEVPQMNVFECQTRQLFRLAYMAATRLACFVTTLPHSKRFTAGGGPRAQTQEAQGCHPREQAPVQTKLQSIPRSYVVNVIHSMTYSADVQIIFS